MINTQPATQLANSNGFARKSRKIRVKYSTEKHILFNFVNFSTTLCPRLWVGHFSMSNKGHEKVKKASSLKHIKILAQKQLEHAYLANSTTKYVVQ